MACPEVERVQGVQGTVRFPSSWSLVRESDLKQDGGQSRILKLIPGVMKSHFSRVKILWLQGTETQIKAASEKNGFLLAHITKLQGVQE